MKIVFGFCIYGTDIKYYRGLVENLDLIASWIEKENIDIHVIIKYAQLEFPNYLQWFQRYPFVTVEMHTQAHLSPMISRILNIDNIPEDEDTNIYYFSRDADSRVTERDKWCIKEFIQSGKTFHVIRDHFYHVKKIMGGIFGIKKPKGFPKLEPMIKEWRKTRHDAVMYGSDEAFLQERLYNIIQHDYLVHSNIRGYKGETVFPILYQQESDTDFIGNVYEYNDDFGKARGHFSYKQYVNPECLLDSWRNEQYGITTELLRYVDVSTISEPERTQVLNACYQFNVLKNDKEKQDFITNLIEKT
jgi:hypothetical protein